MPIRTHVHAAMASGDINKKEMGEFVMQYAIHGGHTRASTVQSLIFEMAVLIEKELRAAP